jgi:hypothetical protein
VLKDRLLDSSLSPDKRTHTGQELCQVKWFGKIVIRSQIQPFDAILNRIARAENEDHFLKTAATPFAQQLQSAAVRQTQVEDDYVVTVLADGIIGRLARLDPHGRVTVFGQILL